MPDLLGFTQSRQQIAERHGVREVGGWMAQAVTDPQSEFSVLRVNVSSNAPWRVTFPSSVARAYTLQHADDLSRSQWSNVVDIVDVPSTGGPQALAITNEAAHGFYRVRVRVGD
jgi:hypothetical protein